jgi:hypothetical protein
MRSFIKAENLSQHRSRLISESKQECAFVIPRMTNPIEHSEGPVARTIEEQTAKLPSDAFQWAPTILILGLYNKLVKQHGSDQFHA